MQQGETGCDSATARLDLESAWRCHHSHPLVVPLRPLPTSRRVFPGAWFTDVWKAVGAALRQLHDIGAASGRDGVVLAGCSELEAICAREDGSGWRVVGKSPLPWCDFFTADLVANVDVARARGAVSSEDAAALLRLWSEYVTMHNTCVTPALPWLAIVGVCEFVRLFLCHTGLRSPLLAVVALC